MPVVDRRQPRPDADDTGKNDRKDKQPRPKRVRSNIGTYEKYGKAHYEKNKAAYIERAAVTKKKAREQWALYKSTLSCVVCGEDHPATFDFHHVKRDPSNIKIHRLLGDGRFKKALQESMEKCVVLCANCHRASHFLECYGTDEELQLLQKYFASFFVSEGQPLEVGDRRRVQKLLKRKSTPVA
jgi:hypothetical protein